MTVLILGAACGYSDEQIQPFLESVNRAIPDSKVVLFMKPGQRLGMKGIQCVYPQDFWLRSVLRRLPRGTRLGSEFAFGMGRLLEDLWRCGEHLRQSGIWRGCGTIFLVPRLSA